MNRYILEPYKTSKNRFDCPICKVRKSFVRYIDTASGEHIAPHVGRCNRENNCAYHYTPKQFFEDTHLHPPSFTHTPAPKPKKPLSFVPKELFVSSYQSEGESHFLTYLKTLLGETFADQLRRKYFLSTSKQFGGGSVIFWQIDQNLKIRTGKIMQYDSKTGKRKKREISWVHKFLDVPDFELGQCFFGEHLLREAPKSEPIAIVESEKTAVIASAYLPQFIWVAASGSQGLTEEKCKVLTGRNVTLFPDLNAFEIWKKKAEIYKFKISDLLERKATETERLKSYDIADYLCLYDFREFRRRNFH
jgi:hypothetical protein